MMRNINTLPRNFREMIREAIGKRLKERKISQRQCALACGLDYQNFNAFLNGRRPLPLESLEAVLSFLELKIE